MTPLPLLAAVIGWPVKHSRSPAIHNYWMKKHGIHGRYEAVAVEPDGLEKFLHDLRSGKMKGCNITVPHKEEALKYVDVVDHLAEKVGAVNTVVACADGMLEGRNTDVYGFTKNLESAGSAWKKEKPALVVGAGGAARAVIVALDEVGCKDIRVTNRTLDRGVDLVRDISPKLKNSLDVIGWENRNGAMEDIGLLVNTTTQGMEGNPALEIDLKHLAKDALVTDIVYTPLLTPLLIEARRKHHPIVDGLGMLLHQAAPAFEAWFGIMPEVDEELRSILAGDHCQQQRVV